MLPMAIGTLKYRAPLIHKEWKEDLHKYITGIFEKKNMMSHTF